MTPFMIRIAELLEEPADNAAPRTRPSAPLPVGVAADRHVAVRSLAEQLVCEANTVLSPDMQLTLTDQVRDGRLDFTIACGASRAQVSTAFAGGRARGRLVRGDGTDGPPVELEDSDALPDLVVRLLLDAGVAGQPAGH